MSFKYPRSIRSPKSNPAMKSDKSSLNNSVNWVGGHEAHKEGEYEYDNGSEGFSGMNGEDAEDMIEETILDGELGADEEEEGKNLSARSDDESLSSDDSIECQENLEREIIIEKYEKGPEQITGQLEKSKDEASEELDRYGFMHKKTDAFFALKHAEKKVGDKETSRVGKWHVMLFEALLEKARLEHSIEGRLEMMKEDKKMAEKSKRERVKLRSRVWKGIPERWRSEAWIYLLRARKLKSDSEKESQCPNLYNNLLMRAKLVSKDIKQIDLDINRTYRDHVNFKMRYGIGQKSLLSVLAAYAVYNTEVGYCQGMSQIAALFLMYMNEEDAFWCLHSLLIDSRYSMHGFFVPGFPKLLRFQAHYEKILQRYLPRVKKHLDKASIPPIYLTKWWFGCYLDRVPFTLALRLWDVFLLEGDVILIAMAYNIMKMHQKSIRKLQIEDFMNYIQTTIALDFGYSDKEVMRSLDECLRRLREDKMDRPLSPPPDDNPEKPKIKFGPILARSMFDIREGIRELKSRHSRANSVAGRSPGMLRCGLIPPSPNLIRARLATTLGVEEESEVPSSSSASTIKSLKDIRSNTQTPLQQSLPASISPNHASLQQSEKITIKTAPQHSVSNVVVVAENSLNKSEAVSPLLIDRTRDFSPTKKTRYEVSPMVTARYRTLSPDYSSDKGTGLKTVYSTSNAVELDSKETVELSRGEQIKIYESPPEPAIDYDISPNMQRNLTNPTNFPTSDNVHANYRTENSSSRYMFRERRLPFEDRSLLSGNVKKHYGAENDSNMGTDELLYDNLNDINATQPLRSTVLESNYSAQPAIYNMRTGEVQHSITKNEMPNNGRFPIDFYSATSRSAFSPRSYDVHHRNIAPIRCQTEHRYGAEISSRVTKAPNYVTIVSVGDEEGRVMAKAQRPRLPIQNNFYYKNDNVGSHHKNEQRFYYGDDRPHHSVPFTQSSNYYGRNIGGGEVYNIKPKFITSERRYPPDTAAQPHYPSMPSHPHSSSSHVYGNRLRF